VKYYEIEKALDDINLKEIIKNLYQTIGFKEKEEFKNYLNTQNLEFSLVKKKLAIEMLWNNLIYEKFKNRVIINESEIKDNLDQEIKKIKFSRDVFLSEILIKNSKDLDLEAAYSEILKSIENVGFATTANIFSISDTAKIGGKIGWVKETSLSKKILKNIINLKKGEISQPIKINENFLILGIDNIKINKQKIDKNKILLNRISYIKNQQLERFSLAYFAKVKQSIQINEL
jgi:peptidyl-prolyl cis-trans isomerase SurA